MLDKTKKDNRVKVLRGKLQKVALNLTENVKYNMTNFMKRPSKQKTRFERELYGDMLATNSKDKMQLLTNLESTRDDKILERDEDGDIVNSLGDTRGTALVHSFSEEHPHGIVSPIDKGEQEYQQTKALIKTTADGKPPRMTQERATRTLENIEKGNARKGVSINPTYKFKVSKLKGKLQKMAAVGLPDNFGKDPEEKKNFEIKVKGGPKGITKNPTNEKFYKQFPRKVGNGLRKIELGGIDMSTNPLITFKPKKIQQNKGVSTLTKARSFYIKKRGDITKGAPVKGHIKDPSGIHKLDKGEDVIADNSLKNELKKENRLFKKTGKLQARLQKIATDINRSPVNNTMSKSDEIINSFKNSGLSIEGVDGIYDTKNHKVLDGYNQEDISRIRDIYGEGVFIGTNSETDTRDGPNTNDLERTRKELQSIEDKGGLPALGFDSTKGGSLEALNVAITDSKEKVMDALYDTQWGTYIISPNNSSEIVNNPNYTDINK